MEVLFTSVSHLLPTTDTTKYSLIASSDQILGEECHKSQDGRSRVKKRRRLYRILAGVIVVSIFLLGVIAFVIQDSSKIANSVFIPSTSNGKHPIQRLFGLAEDRYQKLRAAQSSNLQGAVAEYQRRHGMPPPPHFDIWYKFARQRHTELIDEFDVIMDSLKLFWGVDPATIRQRAREVLGSDDFMMGAAVRDGHVRIIGSGQPDFQVPATHEMISVFAQWLPDMDLPFNVHDEPRVIISHEDEELLHYRATEAIQQVKAEHNSFHRPVDLSDDVNAYPRSTEIHFSHLDHQQTFAHSSVSCPPSSPSRSLDGFRQDTKLGLEYEGITFVNDTFAFSDICLSPSVRKSIGLFNHPNAYSVSHNLVPVFSPSKLSSFHDILYPAPWYYSEQTDYDDQFAVKWDQKSPDMYWRGATSGGFSEGGTWHNLLRQSILSKLVEEGTTQVLTRFNHSDVLGPEPSWTNTSINKSAISHQYDTFFTEIKQCAPTDCAQMHQHFGIHLHEPQSLAWKHRYLLDMDGNAMSGRFYALLRSLSLPMKVAYYREWHMDRIFPWLHYVPLSATTNEYAETLRFFEQEPEGQQIARAIAENGSKWAGKVVRKTDMEVYMFRLLLEYGRVIDDDRINLGYHG